MRGMDGLGEVTYGVEGAFKTESRQSDLMPKGRLLHHRANQVIGNDMDQEFFFDHFGRQAAQDVEGQQGFDLPEVQFDAPALQVNPSVS